jgi:L-lactate dehydrogenase complex protein LldG
MTRSGDARREIMAAIREHLARSGRSSPPVPLSVPERGDVVSTPSPEGRRGQGVRIIEGTGGQEVRTRFTERLAAVGAQCSVVRGEPEAAGALAGILSGAGARRVVGSDAPLVQRLLRPLRDRFEIVALERLSRDDLFACDVGVTTAQWGIAETGTLVLESARERSRLLSLVPPIHVAVLSTRCICESLGDALARVSQAASHAITFITGPSRTSDIELTLVVGVHGPQTVHVLLLEET